MQQTIQLKLALQERTLAVNMAQNDNPETVRRNLGIVITAVAVLTFSGFCSRAQDPLKFRIDDELDTSAHIIHKPHVVQKKIDKEFLFPEFLLSPEFESWVQVSAQDMIVGELQKSNARLESIVVSLGGIVRDSMHQRSEGAAIYSTAEAQKAIARELQRANTIKERLILVLGGTFSIDASNNTHYSTALDSIAVQTDAQFAIAEALKRANILDEQCVAAAFEYWWRYVLPCRLMKLKFWK
jgi:hypothetical protein